MIPVLLGALAIGLSLGLLGSGGSILTVPVLVYLVGQEEKTAIAGSLFIVGAIALAGGLLYARKGAVDWRSVVFFGLPGMAGTWGGAWLSRFVSGPFQLAVFAAVALVAAALMLRPPAGLAAAPGGAVATPGPTGSTDPARSRRRRAVWKIALDGLAVGALTGFVGVGGGFLIVPALVLVGGLPMALAVGTSLLVIALKSFTGFAGYLEVLAGLGLALDWRVIGLVTGVGVVGSFAGRAVGSRVPQERLRRIFAFFLVAVALFVLWRSLPEAIQVR